jgi:hypothetical protein
MDRRRSVECGNHRYRNVDQFQQDLLALAINFVVSARREKIKTFGIDAINEGRAYAGQNDHAISLVLVDLMEAVHELLMGVSIEDQRVTFRMEDSSTPSGGRVSSACWNVFL